MKFFWYCYFAACLCALFYVVNSQNVADSSSPATAKIPASKIKSILFQNEKISGTDDGSVGNFEKSYKNIRNENKIRSKNDYAQFIEREELSYRIAGGGRTPKLLFHGKYMVSVRTRSPAKYFGDNHLCGGTIIAKHFVLTAAHCVVNRHKVQMRPRLVIVVAGTPNRLQIDDNTQILPITKIYSHVKFLTEVFHNIALLKTLAPFDITTDFIEIVKLPKAPPVAGTICIAFGWGRHYPHGPLADKLVHVATELYTPKRCCEMVENLKENDGTICGSSNVFLDEEPCHGDHGGPLFCNGSYTGLISWTIACGENTLPSLYTDVYSHLPWIHEMMSKAANSQVSSLLCTFLAFVICMQHF